MALKHKESLSLTEYVALQDTFLTLRLLLLLLLLSSSSSMLCPLKFLPSTHMYLFLHSLELVLGKALASRTEITMLSHLQDTEMEKYLGLIDQGLQESCR